MMNVSTGISNNNLFISTFYSDNGTKAKVVSKNFDYISSDSKDRNTDTTMILFSKSGVLGVFQLNDFNQYYFSMIKDNIAPVFNKVITNLLKKKEFLALQLNHEFGNIDEKEYFDEEANYLSEPQKIPIEKLKNEIEILYHFSNKILDSEELSEALDCSIDDAENALRLMLPGLNKTNA